MKQNNDSKNTYETTPKTRELMKDHPNLKAAPSKLTNNTKDEPDAFPKERSSSFTSKEH